MPDQPPFSDVWLLYSILLYGKGSPVSLTDVIAAGDAVNHAIFTLSEIQDGTARLVTNGYVVLHAQAIEPTPASQELWSRVTSSHRRGLLQQMAFLGELLRARPWSSKQLGFENTKPTQITAASLDAAYKTYRSRTAPGRHLKK